jgi:hypothetical protein
MPAFDPILAKTLEITARFNPAVVPVAEDMATRLAARSGTKLEAREYELADSKFGSVAQLKWVYIQGVSSEILNVMIYPNAGSTQPIFVAEMMIFGKLPQLVFLDLQCPGFSSVQREELRVWAQSCRDRVAFETSLETALEVPPAWAIKHSSGANLWSQPKKAALTGECVRAYELYLQAWLGWVEKTLDTPAVEIHPRVRQYKDFKSANWPGKAYMNKMFDPDWSDRFQKEFLYA